MGLSPLHRAPCLLHALPGILAADKGSIHRRGMPLAQDSREVAAQQPRVRGARLRPRFGAQLSQALRTCLVDLQGSGTVAGQRVQAQQTPVRGLVQRVVMQQTFGVLNGSPDLALVFQEQDQPFQRTQVSLLQFRASS